MHSIVPIVQSIVFAVAQKLLATISTLANCVNKYLYLRDEFD